ncbi:hypothetical protein LCGC14_2221670, partial [marine sediment metagenome]
TARRSGAEPVFARQLARCDRLLDELGEGDFVRVLLASSTPKWLATAPIPVNDASRDELRCVREALAADSAVERADRVVIVITDGQANSWRAEAAKAWRSLAAEAKAMDVPCAVNVADVGPRGRPARNLAVESITASRYVTAPGRPITLAAKVANTGDTPIEAMLATFSAGGEALGAVSAVATDPGESTTVKIEHVFNEAGVFEIACTVEANDDLPLDDAGRCVVEVVTEIPILVAAGNVTLDPVDTDVGYLLAALGYKGQDKPGSHASVFSPTLIASADLAKERLDDYRGEYEETFGMTPLFGSQAYESAERLALEDWRNEQAHIPDDRRADMEVGLFVRSRELREGAERPPPDVDSKYDILVDSIKVEIAAAFMTGRVTEVDGKRVKHITGLSEAQALRFAREPVDTWLADIEKDIRKDNPDADDQTVREQLYRTLRIQEHLSDVLDEWGFPRGEGINPPLSAIDEALQREAEEVGDLFKDFPDRPGLLEQITSLFNEKWIPTATSPTDLALGLARKIVGKEEEAPGRPLEFISLDDVHRSAQTIADPVARGFLGTVSTPPLIAEKLIEEGRLPSLAEVRDMEEGGVVSGKLRGELAEDVLSEIISPEFILIA